MDEILRRNNYILGKKCGDKLDKSPQISQHIEKTQLIHAIETQQSEEARVVATANRPPSIRWFF